MSRVAVVGGGIAGLAAAWYARRAGHDVVLLEADERVGGKIRTASVAGVPVDEGADAFLARVPAGVELCREIGLDDRLESPATGRAYLWLGGRLRPIPDGTVLGVPVDLDAVGRAGVLSDAGLARAAAEPGLPGLPIDGDVSIGELVRARFGDEVADRLVDPLLGGINAGGIDHLSIDVAAPQLAAVARAHASLARGLRTVQSPRPGAASAPVFYRPQGGMEVMTVRLRDRLAGAGVELRTGAEVASMERDGRRWRLDVAGTAATGGVEADGVVLATPAPAAAHLLAGASPTAAAGLAAIDHASVVLVTLAYAAAAVGHPLDGSGFLVPRSEDRLLTACSWWTSKWGLKEPEGVVLVRASAGRRGDRRALDLDDGELVERIHAELVEAMSLTAEPMEARVRRWPGAFPQFAPGHLARMAAIEAALGADAPGVVLAGAHVRGVGIPTCITVARAAVEALGPP